MADKKTEVSRDQQSLTRRDPSWAGGPFRMLERFADEIDNVFDDFGLGRTWLSPRGSRLWRNLETWTPAVEIHQQNNELVVRADLPGMKKEDISVDVTDNAITISGERRQEQETEKSGFYRSERSYGSFSRTIKLPEGAMADQAKATFKDGVLEVRLPAPPEGVTRGRHLEIKEGTETKR